ncbi:MAG: hypothetical protein BGO26_00945 [Actinobacteria bacterium 69-20]|nr:MAG: hypothetical protein BGO26_00945 [Actinobacteria bacterium 69-20]
MRSNESRDRLQCRFDVIPDGRPLTAGAELVEFRDDGGETALDQGSAERAQVAPVVGGPPESPCTAMISLVAAASGRCCGRYTSMTPSSPPR